MGYNYIYLFCVLILIMVIVRFFLPFLIYLIPILLIVYVVKAIFTKNTKTKSNYEQTTDQQSYQQ